LPETAKTIAANSIFAVFIALPDAVRASAPPMVARQYAETWFPVFERLQTLCLRNCDDIGLSPEAAVPCWKNTFHPLEYELRIGARIEK